MTVTATRHDDREDRDGPHTGDGRTDPGAPAGREPRQAAALRDVTAPGEGSSSQDGGQEGGEGSEGREGCEGREDYETHEGGEGWEGRAGHEGRDDACDAARVSGPPRARTRQTWDDGLIARRAQCGAGVAVGVGRPVRVGGASPSAPVAPPAPAPR
ncbi:hypothetical protein RKE29_18400, partial [Streptomyces sp. B1866]|nr:hypothetical protein [Streptomyces sp. B1866]